jgi:hypothetical protein
MFQQKSPDGTFSGIIFVLSEICNLRLKSCSTVRNPTMRETFFRWLRNALTFGAWPPGLQSP